MQNPEPKPTHADHEISHRADRVEMPQQYPTWREYAFSDEQDGESSPGS